MLLCRAAPTDPTPEHEDTLALRPATLLALLLLLMLPAGSAPDAAAGADGMREAPAEEQVLEGNALQGDTDEGAEGMPDAAWPKLIWAESTRGGVVVAVLLLLDLLKPVDHKTAAFIVANIVAKLAKQLVWLLLGTAKAPGPAWTIAKRTAIQGKRHYDS